MLFNIHMNFIILSDLSYFQLSYNTVSICFNVCKFITNMEHQISFNKIKYINVSQPHTICITGFNVTEYSHFNGVKDLIKRNYF